MTPPTEAMRQALDALGSPISRGPTWALIERYADAVCEYNTALRIGVGVDKAGAECLAIEKELRANLTALRDALANDGWRPIETAPKDGTEFLALKTGPLLGKCICVCTWLDADHPDYDGDTPHVSWDHSGFWDATHWMPLPAAPKD